MSRRRRRGVVIVEETTAAADNLVTVHHEGLGLTRSVRRDRLGQMDAGWKPIEGYDAGGDLPPPSDTSGEGVPDNTDEPKE